MRLFVGPATHRGDVAKLAARFGLAEIRTDGPIPRAATLRAWRRSVGPQFVFSVVLPRVVGELRVGAEADRALGGAIEAARLLEARCLLLQTAVSVRPTSANRDRIAALVERLPKLATVVAWEPAGLWEQEEVRATARAAQVLPVFDAAQQEIGAGSTVYTRLRALGGAARLSDKALAHVAAQVRGRREAFVVVESYADATRVKAALERASEGGATAGGVVVRPIPGRLRAEDEEQ
jgi:uncharacterized protein YecE (DUF72 family)